MTVTGRIERPSSASRTDYSTVIGVETDSASIFPAVVLLMKVGPGDMGKVMGAVKAQLAGKADMGQVSAAVKAALAA